MPETSAIKSDSPNRTSDNDRVKASIVNWKRKLLDLPSEIEIKDSLTGVRCGTDRKQSLSPSAEVSHEQRQDALSYFR